MGTLGVLLGIWEDQVVFRRVRLQSLGAGSDSAFRALESGFRVWGVLGFRLRGLGFRN